jgi:hypothetical protein
METSAPVRVSGNVDPLRRGGLTVSERCGTQQARAAARAPLGARLWWNAPPDSSCMLHAAPHPPSPPRPLQPPRSAASSGAGLPSALLTPRAARCVLSNDPADDDPLLSDRAGAPSPAPERGGNGGGQSARQQQQQQQRCRTPGADPLARESMRSVRWADESEDGGGASSGGAPPPASTVAAPAPGGQQLDGQPSQQHQQQQHSSTATSNSGSTGADGGAPAPDPAAADAPPPAAGGATPAIGAAAAAAARRAPLPESGSAQLDKYLIYLLRGEHPHRFLYYPGWGLSDEAAAALGAFFRLDRRIRVATLSGNRVADDGGWTREAGEKRDTYHWPWRV